MAKHQTWVYTCNNDSAGTTYNPPLTSHTVPSCGNAGGHWEQITWADDPMELADVEQFLTTNWDTVQWAFSASILLWATGIALGAIIQAIRKTR